MTTQSQIKTRHDGSIDTAFYMARGRRMRSETAHDIAKTATRRSSRILPALAIAGFALLMVVPALV